MFWTVSLSIVRSLALYTQQWYMSHSNKEFLCITHTVEHNYISPSSTVGIPPHVSALYVGHLQVVILTYRAVKQDVWGVILGYWELGGGNKISFQ